MERRSVALSMAALAFLGAARVSPLFGTPITTPKTNVPPIVSGPNIPVWRGKSRSGSAEITLSGLSRKLHRAQKGIGGYTGVNGSRLAWRP